MYGPCKMLGLFLVRHLVHLEGDVLSRESDTIVRSERFSMKFSSD